VPIRHVRLTREAEDALHAQIDFLIGQGTTKPAQELLTRVETFLAKTLAEYPRNGCLIVEQQLWETWTPRTKLVVWYTFSEAKPVVLTFWHTSQDRPPK
jgi:plasmid stabilization system protein ParE